MEKTASLIISGDQLDKDTLDDIVEFGFRRRPRRASQLHADIRLAVSTGCGSEPAPQEIIDVYNFIVESGRAEYGDPRTFAQLPAGAPAGSNWNTLLVLSGQVVSSIAWAQDAEPCEPISSGQPKDKVSLRHES